MLINPSSVNTYVLAGGRSQRFGVDKARLSINGELQIQRLVSILRSQGYSPQIIADTQERYADLELNSLVDRIPGSGPLSGLLTALENSLAVKGPGWSLVLACDQVVWRHAWFEQMASLITSSYSASFCTQASNLGSEPFIQPIPGLYHTDCLETFGTAFNNGIRSLQSVIRLVKYASVVVADNPSNWSFNSPAELDEILKQPLSNSD